jgi:hypothetical protein
VKETIRRDQFRNGPGKFSKWELPGVRRMLLALDRGFGKREEAFAAAIRVRATSPA